MAAFNPEDYATVAERIAQFYQDYPDGTIRTRMIVRDGPEVIFEARVYRTPLEVADGVYTSGWAREVEGKSPVNKTAHLENCESSSIGRALANLGYATDARRPTRSEMLKVSRQQREHEAMLDYIKAAGREIGDGEVGTIAGQEVVLKEYVRTNWNAIKEQFRTARAVVEALETATATRYEAPAGEEG